MIAYKLKVKELTELCEEKMKGTKFDKYWVESIMRRCANVEKLQPIVDALTNALDQEEFVSWVCEHLASAEEKRKIE